MGYFVPTKPYSPPPVVFLLLLPGSPATPSPPVAGGRWRQPPSMDPPRRQRRVSRRARMAPPPLHVELPFMDRQILVSRNSRGYFALGYSLPGEPFPSLHELLGAIYDHYHPQRESRDPAPPPLLPQDGHHLLSPHSVLSF